MTGVLFWKADDAPFVSVMVKTTISMVTGEFVETRPFVATGIDDRPNDFVPSKNACDVMLVGHADVLPGPGGATPLHVTVRVPPAIGMSFTVATGAPGRAPLKPPYVVIAGEGDNEIGPHKGQLDPAALDHHFPKNCDYTAFQAAHPRLRPETMPNGNRILIQGISAEDVEVKLPALAPRGVVEWASGAISTDAELKLDTVLVDLDARVVDLTWRGFAITSPNARASIDRVLVCFMTDTEADKVESDDPMDRYHLGLRDLARGSFLYAWEREDTIAGTPPPDLPEEELAMARYDALGTADAPSPTLTLAEHATITAELLEIVGTAGPRRSEEEKEARAELLKTHGFDEFTWSIEEKAHADRIATVPSDADGGLQAEYSTLFVGAQDRLAAPGERLPGARDYATIRVRLQIENPKDVLADAKISLGAWMRIERKWNARMADDSEARDAVNAYIESEATERSNAANVGASVQGEGA